MRESSYHILRTGLAITFLWIGVLILKEPMAWGGYIQPWAVGFLPFSLKTTMLLTAVFDILVGFFLLIDYLAWLAALLGSLHLAVVLIVSGINAITIRDVGLLAATFSIFIYALPVSSINPKNNQL